MKEESARFYIAEVRCILAFIHQMDLVHTDIKLGNILLSQATRAIITHFYLAYDCRGGNIGERVSLLAGTVDFMSPEIANGVAATKKADIWCLGTLMAQLGSPTFWPTNASFQEEFQMAKEGAYEISNVASLSNEVMDFVVSSCLRPDYIERPEIAELKTLPFLLQLTGLRLQWVELSHL